jgi:non-homologous end joining protein Ku
MPRARAYEPKAAISSGQIHKPSGKRVNYQKDVQGVGEVDNADIAKGYEGTPTPMCCLNWRSSTRSSWKASRP